MPATCSFDVTSTVDLQEVDNALNQARKEVVQRYDFKGVKASFELQAKEKAIVMAAPDEFKLNAMWDVLQGKMVKRGVPLKNLERGKPETAAGSSVRQSITLVDGLSADKAREVARVIKDAKMKRVQAAIQGDTVRISAPAKDDLQAAIALLKQQDFGMELKFGNYRTQ